MGRFSNAELRKFRDTSRCSACVHYSGCQIWLALLLMNNELAAPGLDIIVPDITKPARCSSPGLLSQRAALPEALADHPSVATSVTGRAVLRNARCPLLHQADSGAVSGPVRF